MTFICGTNLDLSLIGWRLKTWLEKEKPAFSPFPTMMSILVDRNPMTIFTCKCLNIKIHVRGTEAELNQQCQSEDYIPSGLFREEYEVELDSKGITQEHSYLAHKKKIGNYTVYKCLSCCTDTYAVAVTGENVIINKQLQCNPDIIERLIRSDEFSAAFRIVLLNKDTDFAGMPDPKSHQFESLQSKLNLVQQQLADFIVNEEAAMENRIREYEETQKAALAELQLKVKEEKKRMISLVLQSSKFDTSDETSHRSESGKMSMDSKKTPPKKKPLARVQSLPPPQDCSDDALFSFDGDDANDEEFYADSSTDDDTNDDIFEEDRSPRDRPSPKRALKYSSSVPISVPTWSRDKQEQWHIDDVQESTPSEPDQIAASMQALAQSITDDNRYIFGDRPRPRLNTGDYSNR